MVAKVYITSFCLSIELHTFIYSGGTQTATTDMNILNRCTQHMKVLLFIFYILSTLFISCNQPRVEIIDKEADSKIITTQTSFRELAKNPASFDGKFVEVKGKFYDNFEDVALYDNGLFPNKDARLWINFNNKVIRDEGKLDQLSGKSVIIKGKINSRGKGHLNWYLAELDSVYYIRQN